LGDYSLSAPFKIKQMERVSSVLKSILMHENSEAADIFCGSRDELQMRQRPPTGAKKHGHSEQFFNCYAGQSHCESMGKTLVSLERIPPENWRAGWDIDFQRSGWFMHQAKSVYGFREIRYLPFAELQNDTVPRGRFLNTRTTDVTPTRAVLLL
jgi:hypothetical protein